MVTRVFSTFVAAGFVSAFAGMPAQAQENNQNAIEAKVQMCAGCHGQNGIPADPKTMPIIWGQQLYYIDKELSDYRNGTRENPIMTPIAKSLKQEDLRPIAAYFAAKAWPAHASAASATKEPDKIAMCKPCHQPNFQGGPPAPRLAGLSYEYIIAQMRAFTNGERTNNNDMPKIMHMFSDSEQEAMARYLASL